MLNLEHHFGFLNHTNTSTILDLILMLGNTNTRTIARVRLNALTR